MLIYKFEIKLFCEDPNLELNSQFDFCVEPYH
jgi:hypothetical protein